jgi:hypothetical protein
MLASLDRAGAENGAEAREEQQRGEQEDDQQAALHVSCSQAAPPRFTA